MEQEEEEREEGHSGGGWGRSVGQGADGLRAWPLLFGKEHFPCQHLSLGMWAETVLSKDNTFRSESHWLFISVSEAAFPVYNAEPAFTLSKMVV